MQAVARKFTKEEIIPVAAQLDRTGEYPWDIMKKAHGLGLLNGHIPADVGGMDLSILTGCIIAEELAYGCTGIKTAMEASGLGVRSVNDCISLQFRSIDFHFNSKCQSFYQGTKNNKRSILVVFLKSRWLLLMLLPNLEQDLMLLELKQEPKKRETSTS